ncbi:MAG: class II aldolase/adducin family protein [Deltaproteobacteria bacterium]|nr:class II aldolase/adducin family protein [Deltaproteobacteria bacterium]
MEKLIQKYVRKLTHQGLVQADSVLMGGLDAEFVWNKTDKRISALENLFAGLNINSFLVATPSSPIADIIAYLSKTCGDAVRPSDSETRTFLHDLPIAKSSDTTEIAHHLNRRKCVLLPDGSIAAYGTVSPEEAFVTFSSACFAAYVKFMSDCLLGVRDGNITKDAKYVLQKALDALQLPPVLTPPVLPGPFNSEAQIHRAMSEVGRHTVDHRLVDSHFGNVSVLWNNIVYISQTGSSLDELESCIDPCPLNGSSSAGITASSELTAHRRIYEETDADVVLHGHPRFCAILSLDCSEPNCPTRGQCHIRCDKARFVEDIPIVPGEVGTGSFGLCNTVPGAIKGKRGVIVFGHGLFTSAQKDFLQALQNMFDVERMCAEAFIHKIQ